MKHPAQTTLDTIDDRIAKLVEKLAGYREIVNEAPAEDRPTILINGLQQAVSLLDLAIKRVQGVEGDFKNIQDDIAKKARKIAEAKERGKEASKAKAKDKARSKE